MLNENKPAAAESPSPCRGPLLHCHVYFCRHTCSPPLVLTWAFLGSTRTSSSCAGPAYGRNARSVTHWCGNVSRGKGRRSVGTMHSEAPPESATARSHSIRVHPRGSRRPSTFRRNLQEYGSTARGGGEGRSEPVRRDVACLLRETTTHLAPFIPALPVPPPYFRSPRTHLSSPITAGPLGSPHLCCSRTGNRRPPRQGRTHAHSLPTHL